MGEGGAFFGQHLDRHAHGLRNDEDVAEDNGGVDEAGIAVDGLQGQGRCDFGRAAAGEKVVVPLNIVVLGQVAASFGGDLLGQGAAARGGSFAT